MLACHWLDSLFSSCRISFPSCNKFKRITKTTAEKRFKLVARLDGYCCYFCILQLIVSYDIVCRFEIVKPIVCFKRGIKKCWASISGRWLKNAWAILNWACFFSSSLSPSPSLSLCIDCELSHWIVWRCVMLNDYAHLKCYPIISLGFNERNCFKLR